MCCTSKSGSWPRSRMGGEITTLPRSQTQALPPFGGGWAPLQVGAAHFMPNLRISKTSEALNACRLGSSWLTPLCSIPLESLVRQSGKPTDVACMLCVIRKADLQVGMWSGQMGSPLNCPQRGTLRS